jgi:mono/diheme cytochrome c family protein
MKRIVIWLFVVFLSFPGSTYLGGQEAFAEKKGEYLLLGDVKEGWRVFNQKKCIDCHSIWGEGGKGGPDLGILPQAYVSQSHLAALMWNHGPEMWGRMTARKIPFLKIEKKEMADLFASSFATWMSRETRKKGKNSWR